MIYTIKRNTILIRDDDSRGLSPSPHTSLSSISFRLNTLFSKFWRMECFHFADDPLS
jgi:hypothetical protein